MVATKKDLLEFQKTAEKLAIGAGKILLQFQDKAKVVKRKTDFLDIVTQADQASEVYITSELKKHFPDHNIYSEESGDLNIKSSFRWTIDPLDGTKEFTRGQTYFYINLSLELDNELIVGVVYAPVTNELYSAAKNQGASLNGKELHVSHEQKLSQSIVFAHPPSNKLPKKSFDQIWKTLGKLAWASYRTRLYANDTYHLCLVATGAFDGYYSYPGPKWWDIAAGLIIITEAGGRVTTGNNNILTQESYFKEGLIASNGKIHTELLKIVKGGKYDKS